MQPLSDDEFDKLSSYTKTRYGLDLSHKKTMVEGRLQNYLSDRGYDRFSQYFQQLMNDSTGNEANALMNRLTTNYTFFMREPKHFEYFRDTILPQLAADVKDRDLRIWSAGCSSGEEPYTLAMMMDDYFGKSGFYWDKKILATDISVQALEIAARGTYSPEQVKSLPPQWRLQYFERTENGHYRLVPSIRNEVVLRKFNLMEPYFPFKQKFHVIFCRNVMIYFDDETKRQLVNRFYDNTAAGGYLIIGHSESINRKETGYKAVMPSVYRKE